MSAECAAQATAEKATLLRLLTPPAHVAPAFEARRGAAAYLHALWAVLPLWPALHAASTSKQRAALQAWGYAGQVRKAGTCGWVDWSSAQWS